MLKNLKINKHNQKVNNQNVYTDNKSVKKLFVLFTFENLWTDFSNKNKEINNINV